jgi:hypothetical protein
MGMALAKLAEDQRLLLEQMSFRANYYLRYGWASLDILVDRMRRELKLK